MKKNLIRMALFVLSQMGLKDLPQRLRHLRYGLRTMHEWKQNAAKQWTREPSFDFDSRRSSISDSDPYTKLCELAVDNEEVFARFKSEAAYKTILEHVGYVNGLRYLAILNERGVDLPTHFLDAHSKIGDPELYTFRGLGKISPSLLRYFKVASDFDELFPKWRDMDIVEVGIGYGGQIAVLKDRGHRREYLGLDLSPVVKLADKYLTTSSRYSGYILQGSDKKLPNKEGHHFVSNYAFSELGPEIQEAYYLSVIASSKSGYVSWNNLSQSSLGGISLDYFTKRVGGRVIEESPLTHPNNCIVVWDKG